MVAHASFGTFCVKLVKFSRHSEILNFRKNSKSTSFSSKNSDFSVFKHFSKYYCVSKNWKKFGTKYNNKKYNNNNVILKIAYALHAGDKKLW